MSGFSRAPAASGPSVFQLAPGHTGFLRTEALQRTSPLVRELLIAAWPVAPMVKKMSGSDYPRRLVNCFWLRWFPAFDTLPVAPALAIALLLARPCRPVFLLR